MAAVDVVAPASWRRIAKREFQGVLEWYAPPFVAKRPCSGRSQGGAGSVSERQIDQVRPGRPAGPFAARSQQPRRQVPVLHRASDPGTKDDKLFDAERQIRWRVLDAGCKLSAGEADIPGRSQGDH
jgi:hypothetical protein